MNDNNRELELKLVHFFHVFRHSSEPTRRKEKPKDAKELNRSHVKLS